MENISLFEGCYVSEPGYRCITVRTSRGDEIAKKLAMLRLLERRVPLSEFMTATISFADNYGPDDRWFIFTW